MWFKNKLLYSTHSFVLMQYRKFGNTDLHISEIGFGAWAIGGAAVVGGVPIGWGEADDRDSKEAIAAAVDAGINFFDTADFYGLGHSEELLGRELKQHKDVVIATKAGHRDIHDKIVLDYSKDYLVQACEESLRRLQRDTIDYYQLHSARMEHLQKGECIEAMETLKQQGKVRYWGLSLNTFHPEPEAEFLMNNKLGDGFQLVFNLINQISLPLIGKAARQGYGLIARMPLQFGLLTGKFTEASNFSGTDHRKFRLTREILHETLAVLQDKVWPLAEKEGLSKTSLALSFILSHPEISTVIPGIRTAGHVSSNTEGLRQLNQEQVEYLHSLANTHWKPVVEMMEKQG
jgi:aryl-alcohol dehydrogenase-like predicted oxidoreductase